MSQEKITSNETIAKADRFVRSRKCGFRDQGEIIESVATLVALRSLLLEPDGPAQYRKVASLEARATQRFHDKLQTAEPSLPIIQIFERHNLEPLDREMLLLLVASTLGIAPMPSDLEDFQKMLRRSVVEQLKVARALSEDGPLARAGLITVNEADVMCGLATVDPSVTAPFLGQNPEEFEGWEVQSQEQIFERCLQLFAKLYERSASLDGAMRHFMHPRFGLHATNRRIDRLTRALWATFERHPDWPISGLRWKLSWQETHMIVVLMGKELGFCNADDDLFLGEGIARAASADLPKVIENLAALRRDRLLQKEGYIRICGGYGDSPAFDDEATLRTCEFELTDEFRSSIGLQKHSRWLHTRYRVRKPSVTLDQLVLSERVANELKILVAGVHRARVLLDDWGLGNILPYGRGVTALFAGPPGVGKTASAEALANELGKPLLTANYAQMENCFVGETEKNIARVFREAMETNAVLFWDEADAMLYSRETGNRSWENRQVNVLLQELERFEGLCIMATNRKLALDEALERRMTVKIEFERPGADLRREIWRKHLPPNMPVSSDVNLDWLARADLTGGEIKNAVLNAARITLARDPQGIVTMADFEQAVAMETGGRWNLNRPRPIGFGCGRGEDFRSSGAGGPLMEAAKNGARKTKAKL
jgi:AAA+ superfamily predicted ATPase